MLVLTGWRVIEKRYHVCLLAKDAVSDEEGLISVKGTRVDIEDCSTCAREGDLAIDGWNSTKPLKEEDFA